MRSQALRAIRVQKRGRLAAGAALAVALIVAGPALQASAATTTWKDGNTTSCSTYSEGTAYQSRTGIRAYLPDVWSFQQVKLTVWFGSASTTQWAADVTVSNSRSYGAGKFTWRNDTCQDTTRGVGQALNVGGLALAAKESSSGPADINAYPVLTEAAANYGVDTSGAALLADDGATKIWSITDGDDVYFATARGEATTLAKTTVAELDERAFTILLEDKGVAAQYVVVDEAHAAAAGEVPGLRSLGNGVFVDEGVAKRDAEEKTALPGGLARSNSPYDLVLFSAKD